MTLVEPIRKKSDIEKIKQILKSKSDRNFLLFVIGINTGHRISDILKLKVSDVKNKNYLELKEQRTGKSQKIPIFNSLKPLLNKHIQEKENDDFLFTGQKGYKQIKRIHAYRIINSACRQIGIKEKIGTHTLRKTFGYHFYQQTKDIAIVQTLLNHSSPSITMKYIGLNQDIIDISLKNFEL